MTSGFPMTPSPLARRAFLLAIGVSVGVTAGAWYFRHQPAVYQSTARVAVEPAGKPTTGPAASVAEDWAAFPLVSRSPAVFRLALPHLPGDGSGTDERVLALQNAVTVTRMNGPGDGAAFQLAITCRGASPEETARQANAVAAGYRDYLERQPSRGSDPARARLEQVMRSLRDELAAKAAGWVKAAEGASAHVPPPEDVQRREKLRLLDQRMAELQVRELEIRGRLAAVDRGLEAGRPRVSLVPPNSPFGRAEPPGHDNKDQLLALKLREESLLSAYGPEHPSVQTIRRKIALTRDGGERTPPEEARKLDPLDDYLQSLRQELDENQILQQSVRGAATADRLRPTERPGV
jgi:hypothetical protein